MECKMYSHKGNSVLDDNFGYNSDFLSKTILHLNVFITWFVITWFWIEHGSLLDPK